MRSRLLLFLCLLALPFAVQAGVVVIGHAGVPRIDEATLKKIYSGRVIELGGVNLVPLNAGAGTPLQQRFMSTYMEMDEAKYIAYWTVRRFIGKGTPPREMAASEMAAFVQATPGAIGYLDEAELKPGMNVLLKK